MNAAPGGDTQAGTGRAAAHALLEVRDVSVSFAGLVALSNVDLEVGQAEILGLIGANGAGKTTLVNVITGYQRPDAGEVVLAGSPITELAPHRRARRGLGRTFQGVRLFSRLTVRENVEVAGLGAGAGRRTARKRAGEILEMIGIGHLAAHDASALSYGDSHRVSIARALATSAKVIAMDEPAAGMNEQEGSDLIELVRGIRDSSGISFLFIEHNVELVMRLCDRVQVLAEGRTISIGRPAEVMRDPAVIQAYLGTDQVRIHA